MPARTLSPLLVQDRLVQDRLVQDRLVQDRASLAPIRFHMYSPPHYLQRRDSQDAQRPDRQTHDTHTPFEQSGRRYSTVMHINHGPLTDHDHAHPLPPPMQRTGHAHWHTGRSLNYPPPSPHQPPALSGGWLPHPAMMERIPPPPPVLHKVWILDCQSCGTFLTNRGMKAVLLLRPNVPLYSTDALPINCSAQPMTATVSSSSNRVSQAADDSSPGPSDPISVASRTCECLTQTLWCHGCGNGVGYMIVVPCIRCTSSLTATNRTTNGHRFVFYSTEIAASERYYVSGECGIVISPRLRSPHPTPSSGLTPPHPTRTSSVAPSPSQQLPSTPPSRRHVRASLLDSPTDRPENASTSEDNMLDSPYSPASLSDSSSTSSMPPLLPVTPSHRLRMRSSSSASPAAQEPIRLKGGDNLYWHHLVRSGEIPAVVDNPRARNPDSPPLSGDENGDAECNPAIKEGAPRRKLPPMAGR